MTFGRLLRRNLFYHWRGNFAVLLGVAVGTAVLTGALLVGDSLRGSLRDLALQKLEAVDAALVAPRFLREDLAKELNVRGAAGSVSPIILLQGSAQRAANLGATSQELRRVNRVTILGAGPERTGLPEDQEFVLLNAALVEELGVVAGDKVTLSFPKTAAVPRETLLGRREANDVLERLTLTVLGVLPSSDFGANFSLKPGPGMPRNAVVPLKLLQTRLGVPGRINSLLAYKPAPDLQQQLQRHLTLDDWGLVLRDPESRVRDLFAKLDTDHDGLLSRDEWHRHIATSLVQAPTATLTREDMTGFYRRQHNYLSLESRQLVLEPAVAAAAKAAARDLHLTTAPTLVYLANRIESGTGMIPYSIVAALDPALPPPLGTFLPSKVAQLRDDQIVLAEWKDSPLHVQVGDLVRLSYFGPEEQGGLREETATFTVAGTVPLEGATADPDLTPEFPGITDKLNLRDWRPPFPYKYELIRPGDRNERYWEEHRTTPKAYITPAAGQKLWGSRFGDLTSIRFAPENGSPADADLSHIADEFRQRLLEHLPPERGGLIFEPVRQHALEASTGANDFGQLFLGFSIFLIAAALLLVGLLFRLNLDRRAAEIGLLRAVGYHPWTVRALLLGEGSVLAIAGGLMGLVGAILYAWLLLQLLQTWWPGELDRSFLRLHVTMLSLVAGYGAALGVSVLTIFWAVWALGRVSPRALLGGETVVEDTTARRPLRWSLGTAGLGLVGGLLCLVGGRWVSDPEMKAFTFFSSGTLFLTAGLALVWAWMRRGAGPGHAANLAVGTLGVRNAARHPVRSLLTAGLLASSAFLVVAVESFHRDPEQNFAQRDGGSGGFNLVAESDVPLYQDLTSEKGRDELNFPDSASGTLQNVAIYPFRLRAGEDASCLNLYQPSRPRLLGVPHALIAERGGFHFQETATQPPHDPGKPWQLLEEPLPDGAIPVFGEANTITWMLKSGLGQDLEVPNEHGEPVRLRIVGVLQDSVFQSELLMSEANFLRLYPREEGHRFFLIDAPADRADTVRTLLETTLADQGLTVQSTKRRLEAYLSVENTYLATFQALGGLGLVLGALGLAVVLLRSVWERRGELALLRALGFQQRALGRLVLAENGFLLALGLAIGTVAALLAVAPHVLAGSGDVPWLRLGGLLGAVLLVGLTSASVAVATTLRAPLLPALRRE
jgi:putative ABC transport system permease protein